MKRGTRRRCSLAGIAALSATAACHPDLAASPPRSTASAAQPRRVTPVTEYDAVVVHAHLLGEGASDPHFDAVAIAKGRIARVSTSRDLGARCVGSCKLVDAAGGFLTPGFHDAHGHFFQAARDASGLRLVGSAVPELVAAVKAYAVAHPDAHWIVGSGWTVAGGAMPTHVDLDGIDARPIVLSDHTGHEAWVNAAALKLSHITRDTRDPVGGRILRDKAGEPSGILEDSAVALVKSFEPPMSDDDIARTLALADQMALSVGITTWESQLPQVVVKKLAQLDASGALHTRVFAWGVLDLADGHAATIASWRALAADLPKDGRVHVVAMKAFADGTFAARSAALLAPYADAPKERGPVGPRQEDLDRAVEDANRAGFPVAVHAIGDRAVRAALDAFERSKGALHHHLTNRVEHALLVDPADVPRFKELGVVASVQPVWFDGYPSESRFFLRSRIGAERLPTLDAWGTWSAAGVPLLLGSDVPASDEYDPVLGLACATTRRFHDGSAFRPEEALDADAALADFTWTAAEVTGFGTELGKLAEGYLADMDLFERDPRRARSAREAGLVRVWIGGVEVTSPPVSRSSIPAP